MPTSSEQADTASAQETEALGAALAAGLAPGDLVLVSGELGAGKTTFVRGACRALGVTGPVTSPTFTIAQRHQGAEALISHLDLYRLEDLGTEDPSLLADEIGPERIAFVEWPEVGDLPGAEGARVTARVRLEHLGGERRRVRIVRECRQPIP